MSQVSDLKVILQAVYKGPCLAELADMGAEPDDGRQKLSLAARENIVIRFGSQSQNKHELTELSMELSLSSEGDRTHVGANIRRFTRLLSKISADCGARYSGGEIWWATRCTLWGTLRSLQLRLIDRMQEPPQTDKIHGHMNVRGGARRPYARYGRQLAVADDDLTGASPVMSRVYSDIEVEIFPEAGVLNIHVTSPSANALVGCWIQVMQRLGVTRRRRRRSASMRNGITRRRGK